MRPTILLPALAACGAESLEFAVVDGLSGGPLDGVLVMVEAEEEVALSCKVGEGTTDAAGHVVITGPCFSKSAFDVSLGDESLWLADSSVIQAGTPGPVELKAYRAPRGSAMYTLVDDVLTPLPTHADIQTVNIWGSTETVEYPRRLPAEEAVPRVGAGDYLVLTGEDNLAGVTLVPMFKSTPRKFGTEDSWTEMQDWWYLGTTFVSDTEFSRQAALVDSAKVVEKTGARAVRYIGHDALPPGRYAVRTADGRRLTVVDFGEAPAAPAAPAEPGPAPADGAAPAEPAPAEPAPH